MRDSLALVGKIGCRKMQDHFRAAPDFAGDADMPAHVFHHSFDEIETQAHATNLIVPGGLGSIKRLEDVREVRGRNSGSFVLHTDQHLLF